MDPLPSTAQAADPYCPPEQLATPHSGLVLDAHTQARLGERLLNFLLDMVFSWVVATLAATIGTVAVMGQDPTSLTESTAFSVMYYLSIPLYYVAFEGLLGRTPAKWITGTRVVRPDGGAPSLGAIVLRTLVRFVPFEAFSFLGDPVGWHDTWSGTRVISVRRKPLDDALPAL